jgi:hypothetical protein
MTSIATPLTRSGFLRLVARLAAVALVPGLVPSTSPSAGTRPQRFPHPDPRPDVTGDKVLPRSELGEKQPVIDAFELARANPTTFDGIYCVCRCEKSLGHRSLLSCFESTQPIGCMGCREQAKFIGRQISDGKTLEEIRDAVDKEYEH